MKHENSKSEFVRQLAQQYGTNHSTNYFVEKCRALGEDVSPANWPIQSLAPIATEQFRTHPQS